MTQHEIIEMAREADLLCWAMNDLEKKLEAFAKLVAAKEREACADAALKAAESSIVLAMKIEREACALIAETPIYGEQDDITMAAKDRVAAAIRARGQA